MKQKKIQILLTAVLTAAMLSACGQNANATGETTNPSAIMDAGQTDATSEASAEASSEASSDASSDASKAMDPLENKATATSVDTTVTSQDTGIDPDEVFSERDLLQSPDLSEAETLTLSDGEDLLIDTEGIYVVTGSAKEATICVDASKEDKVQIVLENVSLTNSATPCIYVKQADKVFVTTAEGESSLCVTGSFEEDGDTKTDAVIFSKDDLVVNGTGSLTINSSENGISSKDDLKITGGSLTITCTDSALEANDGILVTGAGIEITGCYDGLHAENDEDDSQGSIFIADGRISVNATDDALHATTVVRIDGGELTLTGKECIEGTYIQINDGSLSLQASDDGINAGAKSTAFTPLYEQNGGTITIQMGAGDTDGVDSNGNIVINGGTIDITGQSTFDCDGQATYNGGTIIENGKQTDSITIQTFGGHGGKGMKQGGRGQGKMDAAQGAPSDNTDPMQGPPAGDMQPPQEAPNGDMQPPREPPTGEMDPLQGHPGDMDSSSEQNDDSDTL